MKHISAIGPWLIKFETALIVNVTQTQSVPVVVKTLNSEQLLVHVRTIIVSSRYNV